jgi:site-specific DNA-cytosine methylase
MGFDEKYQNQIVVSDTQAYKQFGNAVVPKVVEAVGRQIVRVLAQIRQPQRFERTWRGIDIEIR